MKKCIGVITLILLSIASHADSVWTGNAAVGGVSEFPGRSEVFRAASNSFPAGTVLEVTNPRGGKTTRVTVIGRLQSPGVFILIESGAAEAIGLPTDHVLPVRVSPVNAAAEPPVPDVHDGGTVTEDTDYNPAAGLDEGPLEPRTAVVTEDVEEFPVEGTVGAAEGTDDFEAPVPAVIVGADRVGAEDESTASEDEDAADGVVMPGIAEKEAEPETIIAYVLDDEAVGEPVEEDPHRTLQPVQPDAVDGIEDTPADEGDTDGTDEEIAAVEGGDKVYFLTPSDLRPPPDVPAAETAVVEDDSAVESTEVASAEVSAGAADIADLELAAVVSGAGVTYIQIGAFENRAILEETARRTRTSGLPYPLSVTREDRGGRAVYKLLIGPLRPAERGVVLRTLRSTAYPDAFPYTP